MVTTLAAGSGPCSLLFYGVIRNGVWDPAFAMNGLLGGMVATCSGVNVYDSWVAILIGILGAWGFYVQVWVSEWFLFIDDPLNASALHMGSGMIGMLAVGFFANDKYVESKEQAGIFYGGTGKQLGYQVYGTIVYFCWSFGMSVLLFGALRVMGRLRVSKEVEIMGMDEHHHAGAAYRQEVKSAAAKDLEISSDDEGVEKDAEIIPTVDNEEFDRLRRRKSSTALEPGQA